MISGRFWRRAAVLAGALVLSSSAAGAQGSSMSGGVSGAPAASSGGSANVVPRFDCRSFGQTAQSGAATLNLKYGGPLSCWASASTVVGVNVNSTGWVPEVFFEWEWGNDNGLGSVVRAGATMDLGRAVGLVAATAFKPTTWGESCGGGGDNSLQQVKLTVTAVVSGQRESASATLDVCIENPATTWPTPVAFCDDANCADDPGVPPGTVHGGNLTNLATILGTCAAGSELVLVEGGVTFATSTNNNGLASSRCVFKSYGTGKARFHFTSTADGQTKISANRLAGCDNAVGGTVFDGITFAGPGSGNGYLFGASQQRGCLAVIDSDTSTVGGETFARMFSMGALNGEPLASELYWIKFDVHSTHTFDEPVFYIFGEYVAFVGGQIRGTSFTADRHLIRLPQWARVSIDAMLFRDQGAAVPMLSIRQKWGAAPAGPPYAFAHTLAITRTQIISAANSNEGIEINHSGSGGSWQTKTYDVDVIRVAMSYEGTYASGPKNHLTFNVESSGSEVRRVRVIQSAFDASECNSSSNCNPIAGSVQDVAVIGNVLTYVTSFSRTVGLWSIGAASAVRNNVGVEVSPGAINLFPGLLESSDNRTFNTDPFDADGDAIAPKAGFGFPELRITPGNADPGNQGVIAPYSTDFEGDACASPYDAGVDCA